MKKLFVTQESLERAKVDFIMEYLKDNHFNVINSFCRALDALFVPEEEKDQFEIIDTNIINYAGGIIGGGKVKICRVCGSRVENVLPKTTKPYRCPEDEG